MKKRLATVLAALAIGLPAGAAGKPAEQLAAVELTATIQAIDHASRLLTLSSPETGLQTIYAGPEVQRFGELKVGDTITFRYYESVAYAVRKAGEAATAPATGQPTVTRGTGPRPAGTISQQKQVTVTVQAVDTSVPSITVLTQDGRLVSFKVEDKARLKGVGPGDRVEITYTEAVMISVK